MKRTIILTMALLLGLTPFALAQLGKGNIYGAVTDASGGVLPGATVTLTGDVGMTTTVTDGTGKFRFLNIDHGTYVVTVEMTGFATTSREIILATDVNVDLSFVLEISTVEETVTVTAETPVVDTRKMGTETLITGDELDQIPTSREPWALMRSVPGIMVDRVNVAGSESGQQSGFFAKGAHNNNNVWNLDGLPVTDMTSQSSPSYYSYDTFDEINFTTGGTDISAATGGIQVNMVTKRGSNVARGSANLNWTDDALQSSNIPDELQGDERLQGNDKADHTDNITDWSAEFGGPIIKDKLWGWGAYGENDIRIRRLNQSSDRTILTNWVGKLNWQATEKDSISYFFFLAPKTKKGRAGSSGGLQEAEEHLYDQGGAYKRQPHGLNKAEWNRVWNNNLISNIKFAYFSTGFTLASRTDSPEIYDYVNSEARGHAWYDYISLRPDTTLRGDSSYFTTGWGGNHEFKFGIGWKKSESITQALIPGDKTRLYLRVDEPNEVRFWRDVFAAVEANYWSAYIGDTFTRGRMTFNAGVRWDRQVGKNAPSTAEGNPVIPDLLPDLEFAGGGQGINWNNISPRFGFTYALDEDYKTVLRTSFARYHGQLPAPWASQDSPLGNFAYLQYRWNDLNGDMTAQLEEVDFSEITAFGGVDPNDPGRIGESVNKLDPDLSADIDYEFVAGVDREIVPDLAVGAAFTWRRSLNVNVGKPWDEGPFLVPIGVTSDDFYRGDPVTANGYTSIPYILRDGVLDREEVTGGALQTNRKNFHRAFKGFELSLNKRLSNRWMGRLAFSVNNWTEHFNGPGSGYPNPSSLAKEPQIDGGDVVEYTGGSGKDYYFTAGWQLNVSGLYQLPAGFDVSGNLFGRQGYPWPIYNRISLGAIDGISDVLAVSNVTDVRGENVWNLDMRIAKRIPIGSRRGFTLAAEVFNVLNGNAELQRVLDAGSNEFQRLDEIVAPRIIRLAIKLDF